MNLYGYADGDPINKSDPFGLCPPVRLCLAKLAIGFELHGQRDQLNGASPATSSEAQSAGFTARSSGTSIMHQHGEGNEGNIVWTAGGREAVYDSGGKLVTDPRNRGSYNLGRSLVDHVLMDVIPYVVLGNSKDDTTSWVTRLLPGSDRKSVPDK